MYADLGLAYSTGGLTGNTLDSHRLIAWAEDKYGAQLQNKLVEEFFLDYFTRVCVRACVCVCVCVLKSTRKTLRLCV